MIDIEKYCKICEKYGLYKQQKENTIYYKLLNKSKHFICRRNGRGFVFVALGTEIEAGELITKGEYILEAKSEIEMEEFIELSLKHYKRILIEYRKNQMEVDFVK